MGLCKTGKQVIRGNPFNNEALSVPACNQDLYLRACAKAGGLGWSWRAMLAQAAIYSDISPLFAGDMAMKHRCSLAFRMGVLMRCIFMRRLSVLQCDAWY